MATKAVQHNMPLEKFDGLELRAGADMHVHLRDGEMMKVVVPQIRQGGIKTVLVMVRNPLPLNEKIVRGYAGRLCSNG